MKVNKVVVDIKPHDCRACPINHRIVEKIDCGKVKSHSGNGSHTYSKIPDARCVLREAERSR